MSSPNPQRKLAAMSRPMLQQGESSPPSESNPALSVPHGTEVHSAAGPAGSPYYSPPSTFMPPESPNTPKPSEHGPSASLAARPIQVFSRPSRDHEYSGVTLAPGQRGSLTAYGQLASSADHPGIALRGVPGRENPLHRLPTGVDRTLEGQSQQPASAAEASGLGVNQAQQLPSRMSFSDLAMEKGVRTWSEKIFDDRWVLRSDEMWNVDPHRRSVMTVSPSPTSTLFCVDAQVQTQEANARAQAQAAQVNVPQTQDMLFETILHRRNRSHRSKVMGQDVNQSCRALAAYAASVGLGSPKIKPRTLTRVFYGDPASLQEVKNLAKIFHEHGDGRFLLPSALPFSRRAMREYICQRIFGPEDTRSLIQSDKEKLILYGSNPISRDALRKYLFVVVHGMAEDMTSPRRDLSRDSQESRLLRPDSPVNTSPTDSSRSEDFDNIHRYLTVARAQQPDIFLDVQQPHGPKSHQMSFKAPIWISDERREDWSTNLQLAPKAPQWIPGERQMDRQTSPNLASSVLPMGPDQRQMFSNARLPVPYERQTIPLAPQVMPYPGYGMNNYSQLPSYPPFNPYYQYLAEEERHRQSLFGVPHGFPGPYHQMHNLPPQLYGPPNIAPPHIAHPHIAPPHIAPPPPINPGYGHHQHDTFAPVTHAPHPVLRPPAPQRLAPKMLRAGVLGYDSIPPMGPSGHPSTVPRFESAQPAQLFNHPVPPGLARGFQSSKDAAPAESAQPLEASARVAQTSSAPTGPSSAPTGPSSAPTGPSSSMSISSSGRLPQPMSYSSSHESAQPAQGSLGSGIFPNVMPAVRPLLYQVGSDITKPQGVGVSTVKYKDLTRHGKPSYAIAINEGIAPFVLNTRDCKPAQWGVVKISNIPYSLTKGEVVAFFGRNAKLVTPEFGSSIHIIMDRSTGKTNDCYVEFFSTGDAQAAVNRLLFRGHQLKIGTAPNDRIISIELSSQDALLKELFPRAKNVLWKDGKPTVEDSNEPFNTGFKAFITGEEMIMLVRHAEQPHRSSYTQKCPQRTYESMISTLNKFPWYSVEHYTVATRNQIFAATRDQIKTLVVSLKRGGAPNLTQSLLTDLMLAGLNAAGFSEKQRWELVQAAEYVGGEVKLSPLMKWWPWEALGRKVGSEEEVIKFYASLFKSHPATTPDGDNPFGKLVSTAPVDLSVITMEEMGRVEWDQFKALLRVVL
ncbi:hypothetical protein MMC07_004838 [Pseudocyphellaria aurata]|nr:hypothetical protein [Pseudocyphellaria aurata]